jgi:hypothetical protein
MIFEHVVLRDEKILHDLWTFGLPPTFTSLSGHVVAVEQPWRARIGTPNVYGFLLVPPFSDRRVRSFV